MNIENHKFIIVTGARRSGTTLMNQILCAAPDTNPQIGEARILSRLIDTYIWGNEAYDQVVQWYFPSKSEYREFFQEALNKIIDNLDEKFDTPETLVLKAPAFYSQLHELNQFFPQSQFVICLRNPLDQVVSEYEVGLRKMSLGKRLRNKSVDRDFKKMAKFYMRHYDKILEFKEENIAPCGIYRYEDLVSSPELIITKLSDFTGLDLSSFDPDAKWENFLNEDELSKMPAYVPQYGNPVDSSRVGRYHKILKSREVKQIKDICHVVLKQFYPELL